MIGKHLGPYEITAPIGKGGMGEVYRATDTRLDRTVAIKVLPEHLASDPGRRERFEREAKAVSSLNHPHICTLYDVGVEDGTHYLVMELVEGQTLEQRLGQGRLPLDQALEYAIQIADALDKAHRQGVVHRDLKPANIMLTKASGVKLLDFGLAKLKGDEGAVSPMSQMPTQDAGLTAEGTILGTLQYMAPEQLDGKDADARTDIFAFGAVVYEMVTGKKAFEGGSQASLIGAIMNSEPQAMGELQEMVPPSMERLLRKCLAKDPEARWQSASDLWDELRWIRESPGPDSRVASSTTPRAPLVLRLALVAVTLVAVLLGIVVIQPDPPVPESRLQIVTPATPDLGSVALSPNDLQIAFVALNEDVPQLWLKSRDSIEPEPLIGTEGAAAPFWSPDSGSIGFFAEGSLRTIDLATRLIQTLAEAPTPRGGTWNDAGTILFVPSASGPLWRVSDGGQDLRPLELTDERGDQWHPHFLPDGNRFLYMRVNSGGIWLGDLETGETRLLVNQGGGPLFSASGGIFFVLDRTLLFLPVDVDTMEPLGDERLVAEGVSSGSAGEGLGFSVSASGTVVYRPFERVTQAVFHRDATGTEIGNRIEAGGEIDLSPTADLFAANALGGLIQLYERGTNRRETLLSGGPGVFTFQAVFSPDGRIAFNSNYPDGEDYEMYVVSPGGLDEPELLLPEESAGRPLDYSPDGSILLFADVLDRSRTKALDLANGEVFDVPTPDDAGRNPQFSPDGRWIAFQMSRAGRTEVYLQRFPNPDRTHLVSTEGGGAQPRWDPEGDALYYIRLDSHFMRVAVQLPTSGSGELVYEEPEPLFPSRVFPVVNDSLPRYAVLPDREGFLMSALPGDTQPPPLVVIQNWNPDTE